MTLVDRITPLILTYNEEPNIGRVLERLNWAKDVLILDSFSTDKTLDICARFPNVRVEQRVFDSFAEQCNFGLALIESEWVLSLDADYLLTDGLIKELQSLAVTLVNDGYYIGFKYCIFGRPLRATLLPPRCCLYRRAKAHYVNDGHAHRVNISGTTDRLHGVIHHDDRKSLSRWISAQDRYIEQEVQKLKRTASKDLGWNDRVRNKKWIAPLVVPAYCLLVHRGILDGWHGWYYALQRAIAEMLLSLRLIEVDKFERSPRDMGTKLNEKT